jgi:hypothetical protein
MKIPAVVAELFHADGQTDMTKVIGTFRNFAKVPKNKEEYFGDISMNTIACS